MKIQDWELICCLHEYQSLSKASAVLYTTQPVLTRRLKQIEDELDTIITYRSAKGLTFTSEGEILWRYCHEMLEKYEELKHTLHAKKTLSGTLKIVSANSIAQFFLPELLQRFSLMYPQVNFEVQNYLSHETIHRLNERAAQVAFFCGDYSGAFQKETLYTHLGYIVSTRPFSLQELPDMPLITYRVDHHTDATIEKWWYDHYDNPPYTAITVQNSNICYEMIRSGLGYGFFLNMDQWRREKELYYQQMFFTDGTPVSRTSFMGYRDDSVSAFDIEPFLQFTREYAKEIREQIPDLGLSNF